MKKKLLSGLKIAITLILYVIFIYIALKAMAYMGVEARVPYKGMLADVIFQLVGGLRSGMGYLGAKTLQELRDHARFVQITSGGLQESHPHDVTITQDPGNYSR